jgi:diaminopimelate decarboxylase
MIDETRGFGRNAAGIATFGGRVLGELLTEAKSTTPAYFYDLSAMATRVRSIVTAFGSAPHLIAYAVKANSAGSVVRAITQAGAGVDGVSGGELLLARTLGVPSRKIVLSGVAKRDDEIELAINEDILALQAESVQELHRIAQRAKSLGKVARVSIRINPSVKIDSHAHIATGHDAAKFGVAQQDLPTALSFIKTECATLKLVGLSTHVGSMLKNPAPYIQSARIVCLHAKAALKNGHNLEYVNFGGGFGIDYGDGVAEPPDHFACAALELLKKEELDGLTLVVEPGRSMVGSYGVLVAKVLQEKTSGARRWLMIDAGMNDLLRPALYEARHRIEDLDSAPGAKRYRVVGPVCESTDDFGEHDFTEDLPQFVALRDAGAYGFTMASEYNARPLAAEIFVENGKVVHSNPSPGVQAWVEGRLRA